MARKPVKEPPVQQGVETFEHQLPELPPAEDIIPEPPPPPPPPEFDFIVPEEYDPKLRKIAAFVKGLPDGVPDNAVLAIFGQLHLTFGDLRGLFRE